MEKVVIKQTATWVGIKYKTSHDNQLFFFLKLKLNCRLTFSEGQMWIGIFLCRMSNRNPPFSLYCTLLQEASISSCKWQVHSRPSENGNTTDVQNYERNGNACFWSKVLCLQVDRRGRSGWTQIQHFLCVPFPCLLVSTWKLLGVNQILFMWRAGDFTWEVHMTVCISEGCVDILNLLHTFPTAQLDNHFIGILFPIHKDIWKQERKKKSLSNVVRLIHSYFIILMCFRNKPSWGNCHLFEVNIGSNIVIGK